MDKKLKRLLAHIDGADGSLMSRFNNPDYQPTDQDVNAAINRVDGLIDSHARLAVALSKADRGADYLANQCAFLGDQIVKLGASGDLKDKCSHSAKAWREAAKGAGEKRNGKA